MSKKPDHQPADPAEKKEKKPFHLPAIPGLDEKGTRLVAIVFAVSLALSIGSVAAINALRSGTLAQKAKAQIAEKKAELTNAISGTGSGEKLADIDVEAHRLAVENDGNLPLRKKIDHLDRILSASPNDRGVLLELGTCLISAGEFERAKTVLEGLLSEATGDSIDALAGARYALILTLSGRIDQALPLLDKSLNTPPDISEEWCVRGQLEMTRNLASDSIVSYFRKALACDPGNVEALYQLARYYLVKPNLNRDDVGKARVTLEHILEINPLNAKALSRMGSASQYLGRTEEARKYYESSLSINPHDYNTRYNLGVLLLDRCNDQMGALTQFLEAIKTRPDHVPSNFRAGLMSLSNNMDKEAVQYFLKALSAEPRNTRILLQLAVAYEKLDSKSDALHVYQSILAIDALNDIAQHKVKLLTDAGVAPSSSSMHSVNESAGTPTAHTEAETAVEHH